MKPQVGSQVLYTLSSGDAEQINRRRRDADAYRRLHPPAEAGHPGSTGFIAHYGNGASEGDVYPAVIVRAWNEIPGTSNLQVLLDGNDTYWATSRMLAAEQWPQPGCWIWPPRLIEDITFRVPHIGDAVHYVSYGTPGGEYGRECRAAIVTEVGHFEPGSAEEGRASEAGLCVLNPEGMFFKRRVLYGLGGHRSAERLFTPGEPVPPITCADLEFAGGTWHWPVTA